MELEMKNVGNILYGAYPPPVGSVEGGSYIFIINNILKIKYMEVYI